jgi:hypothetical protein
MNNSGMLSRDLLEEMVKDEPLSPRQEQVRGTIAWLKLLREERKKGYKSTSLTADPEWLVDMAINRRAGWPDDPSHSRGSAMPVKRWKPGAMVVPIYQFPKKAGGDYYRHLQLVAYEVNTPRLIIREGRLGELRAFFRKKLPNRITWFGEED